MDWFYIYNVVDSNGVFFSGDVALIPDIPLFAATEAALRSATDALPEWQWQDY